MNREKLEKLNKKINEEVEIPLEQLFGQDNPFDDFFMMRFKQRTSRREIYIDGEITQDFADTVALTFLRMQEENHNEPIHIYINSNGGSVMDGLFFCDILDNAICPVTIEVLGYAYSMAGYIAMAGRDNPNVTRVCHRYSFGLIHAGNVAYSGDARKAKQVQAFYDRIDVMAKEYVLAHTKITEKEYDEKQDTEWYMTADEMLEKGLVDKII